MIDFHAALAYLDDHASYDTTGRIESPSLEGRIRDRSQATGKSLAEIEKAFIERQPMGRLGTADDITPLLVYLASDESAFATGAAFVIDGGMTI